MRNHGRIHFGALCKENHWKLTMCRIHEAISMGGTQTVALCTVHGGGGVTLNRGRSGSGTNGATYGRRRSLCGILVARQLQ